jgi:glucose-6-phosphate isomerase
MLNINAYHQPGVEAGKKAAAHVIQLKKEILGFLGARTNGKALEAEEIAEAIGKPDEIEMIFKILLHTATNVNHGIQMEKSETIYSSRFK